MPTPAPLPSPSGAAVRPLDRITLTGLRVRAHHGVFDFERADGQDFVVDLTVHLSAAGAAADDDLAQTVHYGVLAEKVVAAVADDPVDLIETVAERVATVALGFAPVQRVDVTLHKPQAPITVPFEDVRIDITRFRADADAVADSDADARRSGGAA